jgi:hypothetical protein
MSTALIILGFIVLLPIAVVAGFLLVIFVIKLLSELL